MTKHVVFTAKVEQIAVQRKESIQGSSDPAILVEKRKSNTMKV